MEAIALKGYCHTSPSAMETVNPSGLPLHITFGDGNSKRSLLPTGSLEAIALKGYCHTSPSAMETIIQLRQIYLKKFRYQILENV